MDFAHPVEAVVPGVQGRILAVLANTDTELTMRTVASLAGASQNRTAELLNDLALLGIVERREAGSAALVRLAQANEVAGWIRGLAGISDVVLAKMKQGAQRLTPKPQCLAVFGSFVRREATAGSDIDVIAVVHELSADSRDLSAALANWSERVAKLTGNPVSLVTVDEEDLSRWLSEGQSFWSNVVRESEVLFGAWPVTSSDEP